MIPKIIHYCWLSDDPFPKEIKAYIESWKRILPDYELWLWNFDRFPKDKSDWVREAFESKKYAFAADYIRNYALYHHGGIYLDIDVEVKRSFDRLLHLPYFMGFENGSGKIEAAVMGSAPGYRLFGEMLGYYDSRHFLREDGTMDTLTLPILMGNIIDKCGLKVMPVDEIEDFNFEEDCLSVLPYDFFSPIHNINCRMMESKRTIAIHHFAGSWLPWYKRLGRQIKIAIGPKVCEAIFGKRATDNN